MGKDYYEVLGVSRGASDDEIKKGYKKMALKWHPDRHMSSLPNQKATAEEKFKTCAEAYAILSDPEKRRIYDQYGEDGVRSQEQGGNAGGMRFSSNAAGVDPQQIFEAFFGGMGGMGAMDDDPMGGFQFRMGNGCGGPRRQQPQRAPKPPPFTVNLNCSLDELYTGTLKKLKIKRKRFRGNSPYQEEKTVEIKVKAGWREGTKVTFASDGDQNSPSGPASDVVFFIKVKPHDFFQ